MPEAPAIRAVVVPVTPLQQNCTIVWCAATNKAVVIDPGGDVPRLLKVIGEQGIEVEKIWITHGHLDHCGGVADLQDAVKVPVEGPHKEDLFLIEDLAASGAKWGMPGARSFTPDRWLDQGDTVTVGEATFAVSFCPGHTPGHVIFFHRPSRFAQVGDVLFQGSIGRTDLPGGDFETLLHSIRTRLWPLGDEVQFVPGHGPMSTIGAERRNNPFVADQVLNVTRP